MGIESDQLVYDYLSRVGDAAQQRQLPSGDRMRLVSTLRNEIDRQRGKTGGDSPAAVRRILGRLGPPDAVVEAASEGGGRRGGTAEAEPQPVVPEQRRTEPEPEPGLSEPGPGPGLGSGAEPELLEEEPGAVPGVVLPGQRTGPGPGPASSGEPDWWRIEQGPMDAGASHPGILAGIEIPEMLKPPRRDPEGAEGGRGAGGGGGGGAAAGRAARGTGEGKAGSRRRVWPRRRGADGAKKQDGPKAGGSKAGGSRTAGFSNPFLLLAAALLVVGAFVGSWLALAGGWLLAYASRRLSRTEAKLAVFGLPGISAAGGLIWLWGRMDGRWGTPIPDTGMADALTTTWPVVLRTAAVTSAVYLIWRARRK